jgi:hypothetical protein
MNAKILKISVTPENLQERKKYRNRIETQDHRNFG